MKTYKDFDMSKFRTYLFQVGQEQGISKETIEELYEEFIEKLKDDLDMTVHCLTCGVKFPLNNLQHDCQEEDIWLYRYILNSVKNKETNKTFILKLKEKYPLKEENTLAFRGINFRTKEEYDIFMKEANTGMFGFHQISSWTISADYAERFARFVQQGTRLEDSTRKQELRLMFNESSNITGYKGVILAIDLANDMSDNVLCDISSESIGSMNEYELILLPGNYSVTILKEIDKEYGTIEWEKEKVKLAKLL